jgi:hypothetical protein
MEYYFSLSQSLSCIYVGLVLFKSKVAVPTTSDREELSLSLYTDPLYFLGLVGAFGFPNGKRLSDPQRKIKEKTPLRTQERNPQKGKIVGPVSSMENPKIKTGTFLFFFWISPTSSLVSCPTKKSKGVPCFIY